jgi:hypothetical protein
MSESPCKEVFGRDIEELLNVIVRLSIEIKTIELKLNQ